jgi:hypothetical protein
MIPKLKETITRFCEQAGMSASLFIGGPDPFTHDLFISQYASVHSSDCCLFYFINGVLTLSGIGFMWD